MLTAQEIFNTVATHLLTQMQKSLLDGRCVYRHPDGLKCAVGCLITDEEYQSTMEGNSITTLIYHDPMMENFKIYPSLLRFVDQVSLLRALQRIHDGIDPEFWEENLKITAHSYKLDFIPPGESE